MLHFLCKYTVPPSSNMFVVLKNIMKKEKGNPFAEFKIFFPKVLKYKNCKFCIEYRVNRFNRMYVQQVVNLLNVKLASIKSIF